MTEGIASPAPRMAPPVTDLNRAFWTGGADGHLYMLRCPGCRHWIHPAAERCPACGAADPKPEATSGRGRVFTYTVNRHPYNPAVPLPYVIAVVELDDQPGLRFTTNVVNCDPESVSIGMPVRVTFEHHDDAFVPVFEPA